MKDRVLYYDFLRVLATIAVVLLHVSSKVYYEGVDHMDYWIGIGYNAPTRWAVPVFVMLSGALFLDPQKTIPLKVLYSKYILRLIIIFVVWALLYPCLIHHIIPWIKGIHTEFSLASLIHGHPIYLWFLPMLAGVYMMLPILKVIAAEKKVLDYFLVLWFVFSVLTFFPGIVADVTALLQVKLVLGFCGYFLLGYRLTMQEMTTRTKKIALVLLFVSLAVTYTLAFWPLNEELCFSPLAPHIILLSLSVFLLGKCLDGWLTKSEKLKKAINFVRGDLLGVYLIHPLFMRFVFRPHFMNSLSPAVYIPFFTIVVFVASLFTIKLLRKIPVIRYVCS